MQLNQRLGELGRVGWRINRGLRLTSTSSRVANKLAWLMALPFRVVTHMLVMRGQAV